MTAPLRAAAELDTPARVRSLDALRGFDMMWIVGGREALLGLCAVFGLDRAHGVLSEQLVHPEWNGFTAWDLVFPLFLFLAGASLPLSFRSRIERGATRERLALHAARRGLVLCLLGVIYNGALGFASDPTALNPDAPDLRYASVLARIGLAWMFAAWITLLVARVRWLLAVAAVLLVAHSALLLWVPVPGADAVSLEPGQTLHDWIDRQVVPGRLHRGDRDPEGLAGVIPAIATALLGVLAGRWLLHARRIGRSISGGLAFFGLQCLVLGGFTELVGIPINKNLWTASFVLWAAGWSFLLFALFHWLFDERRFDRTGLMFAVIGANAILVYVASAFIDFGALAGIVFGKGVERAKLAPELLPLFGLALQWLILFALYRRRLFLRV